MIFSWHQRSLINFAELSPSGPNGNKSFTDSIGSKLGDCKAKASHMGLNPSSPDGGADKNLTPGSSMQNVLTYYVVASYWAQYVLKPESYRGGNIADLLLHSIFTPLHSLWEPILWPLTRGRGWKQDWLNKEFTSSTQSQSQHTQKTEQNTREKLFSWDPSSHRNFCWYF